MLPEPFLGASAQGEPTGLLQTHVLYLAVGQNQWYHFGVGAPPILVYVSGHWDIHQKYDLGFDPQPFLAKLSFLKTGERLQVSFLVSLKHPHEVRVR